MLIFKCKMCGGSLNIEEGNSVATCDYCGTKQTLPKLNDDRRANLYDRANHFRRNNEFDKAMGIYEQILAEDNTDSEAYWSRVLCRYGIEYVEDPATRKRVPTVNRTQYTSIFDDADYKAAIEHGDLHQKKIFEEEAKAINEIQKGILSISQDEEPFDIFICYKETDDQGRRTQDSVLANDLYHQLAHEGFKVFFSRITLEDKLGSAYEPYIFAALNSAKVMVVIGTKAEYFNAVWVRNEWSRYLGLIKDGSEKVLIPAYRDMDPYDLPEEFSHLQAQDMSKLGFMQDLIRGIKKITSAESQKVAASEIVVASTNISAAPLLKRVSIFLEDGDWASANQYCERVLDSDPTNAQAYLGKLMAEFRVKHQEGLADCAEPFEENSNYQKAVRFADDNLKATLIGYNKSIKERNERNRLDAIYNDAKMRMDSASKEEQYKYIAEIFTSISSWRDSEIMAVVCQENAEEARKDAIYNNANIAMERSNEQALLEAIELFESIPNWRDSNEKIREYREKILAIRQKAETDRIAAEKVKKKIKRTASFVIPITIVVIAFSFVLTTVIIPNGKYEKANSFLDSGQYDEAYDLFLELDNYKDSVDRVKNLMDKIRAILPQGNSLEAGFLHTIGLKSDRTVVAVGDNGVGQCDVEEWTGIVAISAGKSHTVGLKSDGMVVAVGDNGVGQCDVEEWTGIVAISADKSHTVGLKSDGTVVAVGNNEYGQCDVEEWTGIVAISAGGYHTVGLNPNGTVVAVGENRTGQCNVDEWTGIVAISAGNSHTIGLKADGTVAAVGENKYGQCDVEEWSNIVAISAGYHHTLGLKPDRTVVAVGLNESGQCDLGEWVDIVAISAGDYHTVVLKADGTVVAVGYNKTGQCDVDGWTDIMVP
ncbi:MAG: TIR domain-containing protein [Fastidiosipila sp.]|nr:TIR domain-containing protein [Fastidiosipila sp.]